MNKFCFNEDINQITKSITMNDVRRLCLCELDHTEIYNWTEITGTFYSWIWFFVFSVIIYYVYIIINKICTYKKYLYHVHESQCN